MQRPANAKNLPRNAKQTVGTVEGGLQCPWCFGKNQLIELSEHLGANDPGAVMECDLCHNIFEIVRIQVVTKVWARQK